MHEHLTDDSRGRYILRSSSTTATSAAKSAADYRAAMADDDNNKDINDNNNNPYSSFRYQYPAGTKRGIPNPEICLYGRAFCYHFGMAGGTKRGGVCF